MRLINDFIGNDENTLTDLEVTPTDYGVGITMKVQGGACVAGPADHAGHRLGGHHLSHLLIAVTDADVKALMRE